MPGKVRISSAARRDLLEHFIYLGRSSTATARRFLRAAAKAMKQLAGMPEMGGLWESDDPALEGVRVWAIRKFENHLLFYRPLPDGIDVLRVLHGAQDIDSVLGG